MTRQYTRRTVLGVAAGIAGMAAATPLLRSTWALDGRAVVSGETMGTTYRVTIPSLPAGVGVDVVVRKLRQVLGRVDTAMSTYRLDSEVSNFNRAPADEWFSISSDTAKVASAAIAIARMTGGAYDPTIAPLVNLWGFGPAGPSVRIPDAAQIAAARRMCGHAAFEARLALPALRKRRDGLGIDLSGIAEGFAVDEMAGMLGRLGVPDFLIELGGEVRCRGNSPDGRPWTVAVETPSPVPAKSRWRMALRNAATATSGDYRKFFIIGGRRYSHVIDPRTGWPIDHNLGSVTVIGDSAMQCDALATALLVMGPEAGPAFAEQRRIAALFLEHGEEGSSEQMTAHFARYLRKEPT